MVYISGDTHGDHDFLKLKYFQREHPELTREDHVLIVGDFGAVWQAEHLSRDLAPYLALPFTVLFVDGNHENFDLLETFPKEEWNGGTVRRIGENILYLTRGQVFYIEGKTYFTFGGATSIDRMYRTEGRSWWPREIPSDEDMVEANKNLEKVNFKVDYIITHSCDEKALYYPAMRDKLIFKGVQKENYILSYFEERVEYTKWYFGHYHIDKTINGKKRVLYQDIILAGE